LRILGFLQFLRPRKQFATRREYLKREIGSTNAVEIFEIVTPLQPESQSTIAVLT